MGATKTALAELLKTDLSKLELVALMVGGSTSRIISTSWTSGLASTALSSPWWQGEVPRRTARS